ncbi:glycosyl hydrolase family 28-related protein [Sphingomonas sp. M1-B02]|uniref:glycosyl hydrolase family 28-related protein n=1 Tax=Sphingomonas sp. M1-B02 TaxID=3114300 RepID=UPI0022400D0A|nr:glycosyl hydrolase family 28-related protein [Sphingomonas sp. S6-11]UZK67059.1 glycosyl hydrolase family 28-related protein [Sphingomonas sp. S6-11]
MSQRLIGACVALLALFAFQPAAAQSVYISQPDEPGAIRVSGVGDGKADDSVALQQAIDKAADKGGGGIVFLPAGNWRITRTLYLWPGVRIFGVGARRPVILLGANTPGFQRGVAHMLIFAGARPGSGPPSRSGSAPAPRGPVAFPPPGSVPFNKEVPDANPGTFYSALGNIDFRILDGNAAATAIRFHAAQHSFVSHARFDIGSGLAGLYHVANEAEDLHFSGGRYGILAEKTSPAWPFALVDSTFEGQRDAAIREHEAGLTLVNVAFRNVPVGIEIDRGYGDWLWGQDVRFENVSKAAVVISNENNVYTQVGFQNVVAANTPVFARFRDSGKIVKGLAPAYRVASFSHGLTLPAMGRMGTFKTHMQAEAIAALPARSAPAIRPLPPVSDWVSVRRMGAKGDDKSDDTAAIQKAIDTHRVVYLPTGFYRVSDTLRLRPDTVLLGLHPSLTQIVLPDGAPGYQGVGAPKALVESARGGDAIVAGLGLDTNGANPRATALLWMAGANSMVNDVKFQGGHGTNRSDGSRVLPYNNNATADPDAARRWDGQYASLWVTAGGGGTFANIWSPSTFAHPGILISDTETPGRIIQASVEHHVRTEIGLNRVANWELLAAQTEGEAGESGDAVALEIRNSRNILVANFHGYRVTRTRKPAPAAVTLYNSHDIRFRNMHVNGESGLGTCDENGCATFLRLTKFPFDNAIRHVTHGIDVRERQFAVLDVPARPEPIKPSTLDGVKLEKLGEGFHSLGGAAADGQGRLYFVDRFFRRIWRWSDVGGLEIVRDAALDPVNLTVDRSGNLLVLSSLGRNGTVYSLKPDAPDHQLTVIPATPVIARPEAAIVLPVNWWNNGEFRDQLDPETYRFTTLAEMFARDVAVPKTQEYVSPDGSVRLPASRVFQQGPPDHRGLRFSDSLDSYGFIQARPGERVFLTNGSENRTYSALVGAGGELTKLELFADRGGESVTTDRKGRVFVANGQIFVYGRDGREVGRIDVPDRPLQLVIGGKERETLYILTHQALYGLALR